MEMMFQFILSYLSSGTSDDRTWWTTVDNGVRSSSLHRIREEMKRNEKVPAASP